MGLLDNLSKLVASRNPPPVHAPDPPNRESYEAAVAAVDALRKDRDRWVERAAELSTELKDVRAQRDRAWADVEAAEQRIACLQGHIDLLTSRLEAVTPPSEDRVVSWSGFKEGE